jgi:hypothetical protein
MIGDAVIEIVPAATPAAIDEVRRLFREYDASLGIERAARGTSPARH